MIAGDELPVDLRDPDIRSAWYRAAGVQLALCSECAQSSDGGCLACDWAERVVIALEWIGLLDGPNADSAVRIQR